MMKMFVVGVLVVIGFVGFVGCLDGREVGVGILFLF